MLKRIKEKIYTVCADLEAVIYQTEEPVPFEKRMSGKKISLAMGNTWASFLIMLGFISQGLFPILAKDKKRFFY